MPLSAPEIASLKEETNALHAKISSLLKISTDSSGWSSSLLPQKDCACHLRGVNEASDVHGKEELPE
jgi:hypothetical protein